MNKFFKSTLAASLVAGIFVSGTQAATYEVVEVANTDKHKYTFSQFVNNQGVYAITGTEIYDLPIIYSILTDEDFDAVQTLAENQHEGSKYLGPIEDFDALKNGNPTTNDLNWLRSYLLSKNNNAVYQQFGESISYLVNNNELDEVTIFDQPLALTGELTRSTNSIIHGITEQNWLYGGATAPYTRKLYTNSENEEFDYWSREFTERAFVSVDGGANIQDVLPPMAEYGGISSIARISDNNIAVGYASVAIRESEKEIIESEDGGCRDPDIIDDQPFDVCLASRLNGLYEIHAYKWQLNDQGEVVSSEDLGVAETLRHEDDDRFMTSYAYAVNDSGVAVGISDAYINPNETAPSVNEGTRQYAVLYKDGEVIEFTDQDEYLRSSAYDISNAGIAIGDMDKYINGQLRSKFFYMDTNSAELVPVFPEDFFKGSSSTARSINEAGLIVGDGEIESHSGDQSGNPRRRHGFLYNINTNLFQNLNDLTSCSSPYTIVEAKSINDNNEIAATALVEQPVKDIDGSIILDENGNQVVENVIRAVLLKPVAGEIEDCSAEEEVVVRQGASISFWIFLLLPIAFVRRFKNI